MTATDRNASPNADETEDQAPGKKYLLIETNEEFVQDDLVSEAETASHFAAGVALECPRALRADRSLRPHHEHGGRWLQTCSQIQEHTGVLLPDDMGVGKTVQILTFLAWCIESGKFPDLSRSEPPFRPVLIVAPLILVILVIAMHGNRSWARTNVLHCVASMRRRGYTLNMWTKLRRGLNHAEVDLSNNAAENSMRPIAVGRKNWLHVGSAKSGPKVAAILSVVESCRRLSVPVKEYLLAVLPGMNQKKVSEVAALTPARWAACA